MDEVDRNLRGERPEEDRPGAVDDARGAVALQEPAEVAGHHRVARVDEKDEEEVRDGQDRHLFAVAVGGIDELQEKYLQNGFLTESYMIEVLSSELLLESYRAYTEWVVVHRNLHVARLHFLGGEISETSEQKISSLLRLANLPMLLQELALPVTCNAAYCMIPKKSVVFYAELTKDPFTKCAGICLGCGRRECPNRMEEKENFPLRFADMTDRPLSYGYARIFSKADVK